MSELKTVALGKVKPNPFRDLEVFPFVESKVKALQESIEAEGLWEGVIVREAGDEYEAAFGHHRLEAAKRAGLKSVPVIVRTLSDEQMVRMMERENAEEGWGFYYTTVQAVRAAVVAYGAGRVELPKPTAEAGRKGSAKLRYAPSFVVTDDDKSGGSHPYTSETLSEWLGVDINKIWDAVNLLAAVEAGDLSVDALADPLVTRAAATLAVRAAKAAAKAREDSLESEKRIREEARKLAEKQDNKPKAAAQARAIEQAEEKLTVEPAKAAKQAAEEVIKRIKDGDSAKEIQRELKESLRESVKTHVDRAGKDAKKAVCAMSAEDKHTLASRLDKVIDDRTIERAGEAKHTKADKILADAARRLAARANALARKVEG